jgi:hypothetical protein
VINILPGFVLGRDGTVSNAVSLAKGSNGLLLGRLLGTRPPAPYPGIPVHVDDVAVMHVRALDRAIPGNHDYIACSHPLVGIDWAQGFDIVKKHFPKECAEGIFKGDTIAWPPTGKLLVDSTKAEKAFGLKFKGFEEQVVSTVGQYLELLGGK